MAFVDTLIELRNGGAAIELEKGLEEVVAAVRKTGKAGKLTLALVVKAADKGPDIDTVFLQDVIKVEAPRPDKKLTLFFANTINQLSRKDNRQISMLDGFVETEVSAPESERGHEPR